MNFPDNYAFDQTAETAWVTQHLPSLITVAGRLDGFGAADLAADAPAAQHLARAYQGMADRATPLTAVDVLAVNQLISTGTVGPGELRPTALPGEAGDLPIPRRDQTLRQLTAILTTPRSATERAMDLALYLSRWRPFADGNQRTAWVAANGLMMAAGAGLLLPPLDRLDWYLRQLDQYRRAGRALALKQWLYRNAVWGAADYRVAAQPRRSYQNHYSPLTTPFTKN
ncbi:Fic family protein [Levilactobacillus spicheri]|uniref:Fido domain-containing protein n=2 Tax=Levilactobacillus spicheri TaxID=216463 RepID=A0ABQ0WQ15_9LACO|nr:Fic family protein [Levilactobacillus spicheri]KRL46994.1 hypothetical protein FD37_GL000475 [Levilactobacillus spicheri DSM 15429]GEO66630.1 hypothetical protein LSP04_10490 [Levilactobacillus spicheri]